MTNAKSFFARLEERVEKSNSLLCVGIDPHFKDVTDVTSLEKFCRDLIKKTHHVACCFKFNIAFFEAFGTQGFEVLRQSCKEAAATGVPVILDCKRGDIGSTAIAYAKSSYAYFDADAVTVHPYMGTDSITPFLDYDSQKPRAAFVLCKTSNPSSENLQTQHLQKDGECVPLYLSVVDMCRKLMTDRGTEDLGLVVGATDCAAVRSVRGRDSKVWILAPGVGSQGGDLEGALRAGMRGDSSGILIAISRGISHAEDVKGAAEGYCEEIRRIREAVIG